MREHVKIIQNKKYVKERVVKNLVARNLEPVKMTLIVQVY